MHLIDPATWIAQPWRNGAGVTHELVRLPEGDAPFEVRVSVADVTRPAPFSAFPGYQRWLYLLDGGPVTLALDGRPDVVLAHAGDGVRFAGDETVAATTVARPSRDLNFFVSGFVSGFAADAGDPRARILRGPLTHELAGTTVVVFSIAGEVAVNAHTLPRHGCAWGTGAHARGTVVLAPDAIAAVLELAP